MVRKTRVALLLFMVLFLAASVCAEKLYTGNFTNNEEVILDVAVVEILEDESEVLRFSFMLSPGETITEKLPAGHYHIIASCLKGYMYLCLVVPDMLEYPDKPFNIFFGEEKEA